MRKNWLESFLWSLCTPSLEVGLASLCVRASRAPQCRHQRFIVIIFGTTQPQKTLVLTVKMIFKGTNTHFPFLRSARSRARVRTSIATSASFLNRKSASILSYHEAIWAVTWMHSSVKGRMLTVLLSTDKYIYMYVPFSKECTHKYTHHIVNHAVYL